MDGFMFERIAPDFFLCTLALMGSACFRCPSRWSESSDVELQLESGAELALEVTVLRRMLTALEEPVSALEGMADVLSILLSGSKTRTYGCKVSLSAFLTRNSRLSSPQTFFET